MVVTAVGVNSQTGIIFSLLGASEGNEDHGRLFNNVVNEAVNLITDISNQICTIDLDCRIIHRVCSDRES